MYFQKKIVYNSLLEGLAKNYVKRCCCIPYTKGTFHGAFHLLLQIHLVIIVIIMRFKDTSAKLLSEQTQKGL
jgi:hypothetical protein